MVRGTHTRQICIHTAPDNSATGYFFQLPTSAMEPNFEPVSPEWEPMDDTEDDIPDHIDILKKCFFRLHITTLSLNYTQTFLKDTYF